MAIIKNTWISYNEISLFHTILVEDKISSDNAFYTLYSNGIWSSSIYSNKVSFDYAPPGWVYNNGGTNAITDGQRPALYLIKQNPNRFYLFILTSVKVQYVIQRN